VIVTGGASAAERRSLGETLVDRARAAGYSAELHPLDVDLAAAPDTEAGRAWRDASGDLVAILDPAAGFSPEALPRLLAPLRDGTHDLAIAVADPPVEGCARVPFSGRVNRRLARLLFWPVTETRDPWSGWYALCLDRAAPLELSGHGLGAELPDLLLRAGTDLRTIDVPTPMPYAPVAAPGPSVRESWTRLHSALADQPDAETRDSPGWTATALAFATDLAATLALLALGWSMGASNIAGFVLAHSGGAIGHRLARGRWPAAMSVGIGWVLVAAVLALGLRGGAVASALAVGLPFWVAVSIGIALGLVVGLGVGALAGAIGRPSVSQSRASPALRWSVASLGILASVLALHLAYLKVLPLTPEEAYYWNYAIRPALGYLDHPPMVAWLIAAAERLLGHGEASVRIASVACGVAVVVFVYGLSRPLVDRPSALVAAALAAVLPYPFFATGVMMTPDAPLAAAWAASLYFLHRALVGDEGRAWIGVGVALGLGLLSKYTIVTLGPAVLLFCLLDPQARRWLLKPQPYLAALITAALFTPVIYWNYANDWASFSFQTGDRFDEAPAFSLHLMLLNMLIVATPLPLLVLPLVFVRRWTDPPGRLPEPAHASARNRLFLGCVVLVPLAVFAWSALKHAPRLNWTGPIWLATLPLLGWAIVRAQALGRFGLGRIMRAAAGPIVAGLIMLYAVLSYYLVLGIPGAPYPRSFARAIGWPEATRELHAVGERITRETGAAPVIVGLDKYNIPSQVSFFATPGYLPADQAPLQATSLATFSGRSLMYGFWNPPEQFRGRTLILVAPRRETLSGDWMAPRFRTLDPQVHALPLASTGAGGNGQHITDYFYRIGYGYVPPDGG
jgi:dolichol-phosphate mannosyltransferase